MATTDASTTASTQLARIPSGKYVALNHAGDEAREIIAELCGGQEMTERHLPRAKNPSGGGLAWTIPTPAGPKTVEEITGVIVAVKFTRAYFRKVDENGKKIALGAEPPQCSSVGADVLPTTIGQGTPGGPCRTCPYNVFGSSETGRGKLCKERELWFMLTENSVMPLVVAMSTMSLGAASEYRMQTLAGILMPTWKVETSITLTPGSNDEGDFAITVPRMVGVLEDDDAQRAREFGRQFATAFDDVTAEMATSTEV